MKRYAMFVLILVSAATLFAAPAPEADTADETTSRYGRGYMGGPLGPGFARDEEVWNPVEITGTVGFLDGHPVLVSDGKTYLIGAPMDMMYADEVEEGTEIVIRGQLTEDLSNEIVEFKVDGHIMVDQVEINGELLSLDDDFARGPRGGQMPRRGGMRAR